MPRYFMNLRYRDHLFTDDEGDELASEKVVHAHTLETARDLITLARLASIRNWLDCSFEVTDAAGRVVLIFPFSETAAASDPGRH